MNSKPTVLRSAVVFTPQGRVEGDLRIEDGRVVEIGTVSSAGAESIDIDGQWVWPGAVDGHVHFRDPGAPHKEDFESGSAAAVAGGVTTVFDMPNTNPTTTTVKRLEQKRAVAAEKSHCNYGLFFGANTGNLEEACAAKNVAGLKIFMGCSTGDLLVYKRDDLERIFAGYDRRICVHAESELRLREREKQFADRTDPSVHSEIRDPQAAAEAVSMAAQLAAQYGRHLHVLHLSTKLELEVLSEIGAGQSAEGFRTTCEVCPHHLFLDTSAYEDWGTFVRMNPPLRSEEDRAEMWAALHDGRIDMVATDHAPHTVEEKSRPYREAPSGVPGVETMLPLLLDAASVGACSYEDVVEWLCHAPARIYGVADRHRVEVGNWADLVVIDHSLERVVQDDHQFTSCGWSPWRGHVLKGWPLMTFVNGEVAFRRGGQGPGEVVGGVRGREVTFR